MAYVAILEPTHQCRVVCGCFNGLGSLHWATYYMQAHTWTQTPIGFIGSKNRITVNIPMTFDRTWSNSSTHQTGQISLETMTVPKEQRWNRPETSQQAPPNPKTPSHRFRSGLAASRSYSALVKESAKVSRSTAYKPRSVTPTRGTEVQMQTICTNRIPRPNNSLWLAFQKEPRLALACTRYWSTMIFPDPKRSRCCRSRAACSARGSNPLKIYAQACDKPCTPLGPMVGDLCLEQLRWHPRERLDELDFDLPVLGGLPSTARRNWRSSTGRCSPPHKKVVRCSVMTLSNG